MTNLTEVANFDAAVYQIATNDAVLGGAGGIANLQAQALADRTQWLKQQIGNINAALVGINAPIYVNAAGTLTVGVFLIDTSAGGFALQLPPAPTKGSALTFLDAASTWGTHTWTLGHNGSTIMGQSADLTVNVSDQEFTIWYNGSDWRLV